MKNIFKVVADRLIFDCYHGFVASRSGVRGGSKASQPNFTKPETNPAAAPAVASVNRLVFFVIVTNSLNPPYCKDRRKVKGYAH